MTNELKLKASILVDAVEKDITLKLENIAKNFVKTNFINDSVALKNAKASLESEYPEVDADSPEGALLITGFLSLRDKCKTILSNSSGLISKEDRLTVKDVSENGQILFDVRNKKAHSGSSFRTITSKEYMDLYDFCLKKINSNSDFWECTKSDIEFLDNDPSLKDLIGCADIDLEIPDEEKVLFQNLPKPNYDLTGFIGRPSLLDKVKQELDLGTSIITLYGEGGTGKTAIAREVVHKILNEYEDSPYEFIWWHSSKENEITFNSLKSIESDDLYEIPDKFEFDSGFSLDEVKKENHKCLFILDNLETDLSENKEKTLELINSLRPYGQIIITSRSRLGQLEAPLRIEPFNDKESVFYLRKLVDVFNVLHVQTMEEDTIKTWINNLNNSPLLIKLFIIGLSEGLDPNDLLSEHNKKRTNSFIFQDVYEILSEEAKNLLFILRQFNQPVSKFEIQNVAQSSIPDWDNDVYESAKISLDSTCFLETLSQNKRYLYKINDQALSFIKDNQRKLFQYLDDEIASNVIYEINSSKEISSTILSGGDIFDFESVIVDDESAESKVIHKEIVKISRLTKEKKNFIDKMKINSEEELTWETAKQKKDEVYFNYLEEEIMPRLNILIENGARNSSLYRAIGLYLADMKKNYEAKESFTKGYSIANTNEQKSQLLYSLCFSCQRESQHNEAFKYAEELNEISNEPKAKILLAKCHHDLGQNKKAIELVEETIANEQNNKYPREKIFRMCASQIIKFTEFQLFTTHDISFRKKYAEDFFIKFSEKMEHNFLDKRNLEALIGIIACYVRACKDLSKNDGQTNANALTNLFSKKNYFYGLDFINAIKKIYDECFPDDFKKIDVPLRKEDEKFTKTFSSEIIFFNLERGFGFIKNPVELEKNIYFNKHAVLSSSVLETGDKVNFSLKRVKGAKDSEGNYKPNTIEAVKISRI